MSWVVVYAQRRTQSLIWFCCGAILRGLRDSMHFPAIFSGNIFVATKFWNVWPMCKIRGGVGEVFESKWKSIMVAQAESIRFPIISSVLKSQCVKGDWYLSKIEPKFRAFWPSARFRGGWAKCLSEIMRFNLGPNLWYTFAGSPLREFG